ncbi:TPA: hypothetical protein ACGUON_002325 [Vibrio vulnificus]|nr:hypothetical protein [Vibrio vulnificus]HAU8261598.1 hypothetical protein [Vibrio vulnificus]HDY7997685.1 hypothetical protein [Vibrio vulnificus]HDY8050111.1 hypothetical protein [Vibrio vulnificus]HDY8054691.1 hypothetical protein [Vibrio vulnificus]
MKSLFTISLFSMFLLACTANTNMFEKILFHEYFPGFLFSKTSDTVIGLNGYEYTLLTNENLVVKTCEQAGKIDVSTVADYDYYRFKLLLTSCIAIDKFSTAAASQGNNFPQEIDSEFIYQLPATITPFVNYSDFLRKQGESFLSYDEKTKVTIENENTFKLLTAWDEVYLTLLARGDFTQDGYEDLLIQSEWYARDAYGKHVDLVILSKKNIDGYVEIAWRLNEL